MGVADVADVVRRRCARWRPVRRSCDKGTLRNGDRLWCCDWPNLGATNVFALLRLLPMSSRDKVTISLRELP